MSDPRPRVLYVVSRFPKVTETFVVNELWEVAERHPVELAALLREREPVVHPRAQALLPRVVFLPLGSPSTLLASLRLLRRRPRAFLGLLAELLRRSPRSHSGGRLKAVVTFVKAVRLAEVARERRVGHVHAHFVNQPATAAWVVHRLTGIPFSFTAHANDLFAEPALLGEKVREASAAVTISRFNERYIRGRVPAGGRVEVVHCGVDVDALPFRAERGATRILCTARLFDTKGHDDLLAAFAALAADRPELELELIGDGPERGTLEALARDLGVAARVRFRGALAAEEVRTALDAADVFALAAKPHPSGAMDGIPVALMEAMACGVPVVATDVSGIPELVRNGETGLLVPAGEPASLAAALRVLLDDEALRRRLAAAARGLVEREFSLAAEAARLAALFEQSLGGGRPVSREPVS